MRVRDILLVLLGVVICIAIFFLYNRFRSSSSIYYLDNLKLVSLNDEISRQRMNAIVLAANKVGPSVVSITVTQTRVVTTSPFFSPFDDEFFRKFFKDFFPDYQYRQQIKSLGSGVIISSDGYILTNEHVVTNATEIEVTLPSESKFKAEIVAEDRINDLALLKIQGKDLPYVELGNSDDLMIGEWVIALGNPFGFLLEDTRPTVTVGVVSALNRSIKSTYEDRIYKNMIQTDAAINPGNSGGPLVNILGQVVGINTFIFTSSGGSEGVGFARPVNVAKKFITEAKKFGKVRTPWIGIWVQNITHEIAEVMGIKSNGVLVSSIDINSPAKNAGVKEGDRIYNINGNVIDNVSDYERFITNVFVDDTLNIMLFRNGDSLDVKFTVREFKESEGVGSKFGIYVVDINDFYAKKYELGYKEGVVVTNVVKRSIGEKIGVIPGDVILKIGGKRIKNKEDFQKVIENTKRTYFIIDRGGLIIQIYLGA